MILSRRDFLKNVLYSGCYVTFKSTGLDRVAEGLAFEEPKDAPKIDIGALVQSIEQDIRTVELDKEGWYVNGVDHSSNKTVIIIPDHHAFSKGGVYNPVFDIVSKYVQSFGLEAAEYGTKNPLESIFELQKESFSEGYSYDDLLRDHKLFGHIDKSGKNLFGLEERRLFISSLYLCELVTGITDIFLNKPENGIKPEDLEELRKIIKHIYECINLKELPEYSDEIWEDIDKFRAYKHQLENISVEYALNQRTKKSIENIQAELKKNEEHNRYPNIVGIIYGAGHINIVRDRLDGLGISYIVVGNVYVDSIKESLREMKVISNQ